MSSEVSFCSARRASGCVLSLIAFALVTLASAEFATAQVHGVPPSVTSIQFHVPPFLPNIMPSVTSLGPYRSFNPSPFPPPYGVPRSIYGRGRRNGYGYGYGTTYAVPYYVPAYDASAGYDAGAGGSPYLYSAPPPEQTLHIVVDTAPARRDVAAEDLDEAPPATAARPRHERDAAPVDPTVLVFRDGHKQEVSNYAIMNQTLYVFDSRTQKIALSDLDVPATKKTNDDRGVEFQLPKSKQSKFVPPEPQPRDNPVPESLCPNSVACGK